MSKRKRKQYTDEFRASTVLMLQAAGYPDKKGALTEVAKAVGTPARTISRWFNGEQNPPPDRIVNEKLFDLETMLRNELNAIFERLPQERGEATFKELGTVAGIFIDKLQLLSGKPTARVSHEDWRSEAIAGIKAGDYSYEDLLSIFDDSLATELFREAGIPIQARPT